MKQEHTDIMCDILNNIVAFTAFIVIFGSLIFFGGGLIYLLIGGALNIMGVEVPGISVR